MKGTVDDFRSPWLPHKEYACPNTEFGELKITTTITQKCKNLEIQQILQTVSNS